MNSQSRPLQNRVTPFGDIIAHTARGTWMGNRGGRFHDPATKTISNRRWANRAWICCKLEFNDRQRPEIMGPGYTELFFMDEITALAAGHRPCFECRYQDAKRFLEIYAQAHGQPQRPKVAEFDRLAQADRLDGRLKRTYTAKLGELPFGVMIQHQGSAFAKAPQGLLQWSIDGYGQMLHLSPTTLIDVLTPRLFTDVLAAGYEPHWHKSAENLISKKGLT